MESLSVQRRRKSEGNISLRVLTSFQSKRQNWTLLFLRNPNAGEECQDNFTRVGISEPQTGKWTQKGNMLSRTSKVSYYIQQGIMIFEAIPWTTKDDNDVPFLGLLSNQSESAAWMVNSIDTLSDWVWEENYLDFSYAEETKSCGSCNSTTYSAPPSLKLRLPNPTTSWHLRIKLGSRGQLNSRVKFPTTGGWVVGMSYSCSNKYSYA